MAYGFPSEQQQNHQHHQHQHREFLRDLLCRQQQQQQQQVHDQVQPSSFSYHLQLQQQQEPEVHRNEISAENFFFRESDVRRPVPALVLDRRTSLGGEHLHQNHHQHQLWDAGYDQTKSIGQPPPPPPLSENLIHQVHQQVIHDQHEHESHDSSRKQQQQQQQQQQSSNITTCKECGNQAKKDCQYQRCRTCCKSRAFDCQTHVKSTWVPAALRRRDRVSTSSGYSMPLESDVPKPKRARSGGAGSSSAGSQPDSDVCSFPAEVRANAVFKCVRLTNFEDGEDEFAYQTTVNIGGHVFKGVLHDRGVVDESSQNFNPVQAMSAPLQLQKSTNAVEQSAALYGQQSANLLLEDGNW